MELSSPAFRPYQVIPVQYAADGGNHSPPLIWSTVPLGTWELALTCEDLDDVGQVRGGVSLLHWIIYRIPRDLGALNEGIPRRAVLSKSLGALQGVNDFGTLGYTGPLPPVGDGLHRYAFTLYALDRDLGLHPGVSRQEFENAIQNHILESARLIGLCRRDAAWYVA